ncbi:hypothetical protein WN943_016237 [Citrus x changshan-huyou]
MPRLVMHTNDLVNKVSASNVKDIIPELFQHNPIPGRSLFFCFVHEIPIGVRQRLFFQPKKKAYYNNKPQWVATVKFITHFSESTTGPLHYSSRENPEALILTP